MLLALAAAITISLTLSTGHSKVWLISVSLNVSLFMLAIIGGAGFFSPQFETLFCRDKRELQTEIPEVIVGGGGCQGKKETERVLSLHENKWILFLGSF